jgi:thioester reductase-like protein
VSASLLTGATGFIGSEILRRLLLREPDRRVYALVRAASDADAVRRGREVLFRLFFDDEAATADAKGRVRWVRGDLTRPGLALASAAREEIVAECDELIHAAASTDFDLPLDEAAAVNVAGVRAIAELAARSARGPRPARLVHVSTAYVAGRRDGVIHPEELPGPGGPFNNTYEATKAEAERFLRERMGEMPVTVVRPSIVVGDSETGRTFNFNVLYFPIKLFYRGLLPVVPGRRSTTLDIVPVDYVCDALLALGRDPAAVGGTFHLTADDDAMPLKEFADRIIAFFNERRVAEGQAGGGQPPLGRPKLIGALRWRVLHWWLRRRLPERSRRQLDAFDLYLPYITTDKRFVAASTRRALEGRVACPAIESYILRVAEYAVTREWGREVSWDPALLRDPAWPAGPPCR